MVEGGLNVKVYPKGTPEEGTRGKGRGMGPVEAIGGGGTRRARRRGRRHDGGGGVGE